MKFSIVFCAIFCLSAISAAPTQEPSALAKAAAEHNRQFIVECEKAISGWDSKAPFGSNLFNLLTKPFDTKALTWNPSISAKENVVSYFAILQAAEANFPLDTSTYVDQLWVLGLKFLVDNKLPNPLFNPQSELEIEINNRFAKFLKGEPFINKVNINMVIQTWLESLADLKFADPKVFIKSNLENIAFLTQFIGFSADTTLEDIVFQLTEYIYEATEY